MSNSIEQNYGEQLKIEFPCLFDYVPIVRRLVSTIAQARNFSKKDAYRIETLVDEICNNAIEYGSLKVGSTVILECKFTEKGLEFTVSDDGGTKTHCKRLKEGFIKAVKNKDRFAGKRGRGLQIVKMLADKLDISSSPVDGQTEVHITKWKRILL